MKKKISLKVSVGLLFGIFCLLSLIHSLNFLCLWESPKLLQSYIIDNITMARKKQYKENLSPVLQQQQKLLQSELAFFFFFLLKHYFIFFLFLPQPAQMSSEVGTCRSFYPITNSFPWSWLLSPILHMGHVCSPWQTWTGHVCSPGETGAGAGLLAVQVAGGGAGVDQALTPGEGPATVK